MEDDDDSMVCGACGGAGSYCVVGEGWIDGVECAAGTFEYLVAEADESDRSS